MVSCMTLLSYHVHIYFVTSNRESLHFFSNTATTGRITGFDFVNATTFYEDPHMDMMTQRPNFAGGKWVISTDDDDYDPNTLTFADPAFTDVSRIENIRNLEITDNSVNGTGEIFYGAYGIDFSPVITVSSIKYILLYLYLHFKTYTNAALFLTHILRTLGPVLVN